MSTTRPHVLRLYKQILRLGAKWEASSGKGGDTLVERNYIKMEATSLFRQNSALSDPKVIQDCIHEGQARLELGGQKLAKVFHFAERRLNVLFDVI